MSFLPLAKKIFASTISLDLVQVQPMHFCDIEKIEKQVKQENRKRKLESLLHDKKFTEMKVSEHPEFKGSLPRVSPFYFDYNYGTTGSVNP